MVVTSDQDRAPRVSVVVPNYNHARFLPQRLDSILNQTFADFELILLDDCSTDSSRQLLEQYRHRPGVRLHFNTQNSGSTFKQWNLGVSLARGELIWLAESDDAADPRLLERLVGLLDERPRCSFAYCRSRKVDADNIQHGFADEEFNYLSPGRWGGDLQLDGTEECRKFLLYRCTVPTASAVVFRRAAYERIGGADESLRLTGDWKTWFSLALGSEIAYTAEPLNYWRHHPANVRTATARGALNIEEDFRVTRYMVGRLGERQTLRGMRPTLASRWAQVLRTRNIPLRRKLAITRHLLLLDPAFPGYIAWRGIRSVWRR